LVYFAILKYFVITRSHVLTIVYESTLYFYFMLSLCLLITLSLFFGITIFILIMIHSNALHKYSFYEKLIWINQIEKMKHYINYFLNFYIKIILNALWYWIMLQILSFN
jgi:hypothetical protein